MEFIGTQFNLTLGNWRVRFAFAVEDVEEQPPTPAQKTPHRLLYSKSNEGHRVG